MSVQFNNLKAMSRKPYYATANVFQNAMDLSWIPSVNQVTFDPSVHTPDGSRTSFDFVSPPRFIVLNGNWMRENAGYTRVNNTITFPYPLNADDELWAVL